MKAATSKTSLRRITKKTFRMSTMKTKRKATLPIRAIMMIRMKITMRMLSNPKANA